MEFALNLKKEVKGYQVLKVFAQCIDPYGNIYSDAYQSLSSIFHVMRVWMGYNDW